MLDAGIVDEDIDAAELFCGKSHHGFDFGGLAHIRGAISDADSRVAGELGPRLLDCLGIAETVEHDIRT